MCAAPLTCAPGAAQELELEIANFSKDRDKRVKAAKDKIAAAKRHVEAAKKVLKAKEQALQAMQVTACVWRRAAAQDAHAGGSVHVTSVVRRFAPGTQAEADGAEGERAKLREELQAAQQGLAELTAAVEARGGGVAASRAV